MNQPPPQADAEAVLRRIAAQYLLPRPDPEFEHTFRAYANYLEDLAGVIGGHHGMAESVVEGVYRSMELHPAVQRVRKRPLEPARRLALESALRKAWGHLRRLQGELNDPGFDGEANAWLPQAAYNAIYHALLALAVASGQPVPRHHRAALNMISKEVRRGLLVYPWASHVDGCPQTGTHAFHSLPAPSAVHVLSRPDPDSADDRLAMLLRTTRQKELETRFAEDRNKKRAPGCGRRNLTAAHKEQIAARLAPTTLFDVFWRLRKKASYDDSDVFVLGSDGLTSSRTFAESLVIVTNATLAALEAGIGAYTGPAPLVEISRRYLQRIHSDRDVPVRQRATAWRARAVAADQPPVKARGVAAASPV